MKKLLLAICLTLATGCTPIVTDVVTGIIDAIVTTDAKEQPASH